MLDFRYERCRFLVPALLLKFGNFLSGDRQLFFQLAVVPNTNCSA